MSSNKVGNIVVKKKPKVFQAVSNINFVLCLFCLERVDQLENGIYVFKNYKFKFAVIAIMASLQAIGYVIGSGNHYSKYSPSIFKYPLIVGTDMFSTAVWATQSITCMAIACWESDKVAQNHYDTVQKADDVLYSFKHDVYEKQKLRCNLLFYGILAIASPSFVMQMYAYTIAVIFADISYLTMSILLVGWCLICIVVLLNIANYVVRLDFFRTRLIAFRDRQSELTKSTSMTILEEIGEESDQDNNCSQIDGMVMCYNSLYQHCDCLNKRFGFQVVIIYTNLIAQNVASAYLFMSVIGNKYSDDVFDLISYALDAIIYNIYCALIIEYAMSMDRIYRDIIFSMENYIVNHSMSERPRERCTQLMALYHRQPIEFTAFGFFDINYSLLAGILGVTVTYTIILVQINNSGN